MAPSQASQTSWYHHPALVSLAVVASAYTLYRLHVASNRFPTSTLHRSNAVHQSRRRRSEMPIHADEERGLTLKFYQPTLGEPLGTLMILDNASNFPPTTMMLRLGLDLMPPVEDLERFHLRPEAAYLMILEHALFSSLAACIRLRDEPELGVQPYHPVDFGFRELWTAVRTRNAAELVAQAPSLPLIFNLVSTTTPLTNEVSHKAVHHFFADEAWQLPPGGESLDPLQDAVFTDGVPAESDRDVEQAADGDGIRGLLYYIAEENATRRAYIHRGIRCEGCNELPILGVRYHCLNCTDYDLCATCEAHAIHPKTHVFAKIKIPLSLLSQPPKPHKLWYAGDPQRIHPSLDVTTRKQFCTDFGFEEEELDALYDQFTCIANVPWPQDPTKIAAAIDRRAFNKAMSSERWNNRFAPNVLLDRMFAFYDTDCNTLIGFQEFISGMEYLRGKKRFASLQRALQGFDMDGDSYVTRADFVRLLRGKFEIHKQLIIDATEGQETERSLRAMDILRSSQPISSVFNGEVIPRGEERRPRDKWADQNGDMVPFGAGTTILDDEDPFFEAESRPGHEELIAALDRFEDLLTGQEQADTYDSESIPALQVLEAVHPPNDIESTPYMPDLLWHYKEAGLNALLDPLFSTREEIERRASVTRDARERWRAAIDQFRVSENITSAAELAAWTPHEPVEQHTPRGIVPTDHKSLEQRELDTTRASLDRLLEVSGYSIREDIRDDADGPSPNPRPAADMSTGGGRSDTRTVSSSPLQEIQMMQGDNTEAPSLVETGSAAQTPCTAPNTSGGSLEDTNGEPPPPPAILHLWARLDDVEREMKERGGPGRLSLNEVESIIVDEGLPEIRGLVKSWLEWCAL